VGLDEQLCWISNIQVQSVEGYSEDLLVKPPSADLVTSEID
jgi:hypothetical protein